MELVLLRRLVTELQPLLVGSRTDRVYAAPRYDIVVAANSGRKHLWISVEPEDPHVCLRDLRPKSERHPPAFAMAARKWCRGSRIERLELINDDRVLRIEWQSGGALIAELVPRRATGFVVDKEGHVVAVWNPRRGRPGVGEVYSPPERTRRATAADVTPAAWAGMAPLDDRELRRELMRTIDSMVPSVADEIIFRWRRGDGELTDLVGLEVERAATGGPTTLYSAEPVDQLQGPVQAAGLLLSPCPLEHRGASHSVCFESVTVASREFYDLRARLELEHRVRIVVGRAIDERHKRLERKRRAVADTGDAEVRSGELRRRADLLLAAPNTAVVDGVARVPDVYGDGSLIAVRVDPQMDLAANAQKLYRRAQRIEGAAQQAAAGIVKIESELGELDALRHGLGAMHGREAVNAMLDRALRAGLRVPLEQLRNTEAGTGHLVAERSSQATPSLPGIMAVTTPKGHEILVGRSASSNDRLTREVAAKHDWWLHAEGPGSHVVLRNPRRLEQPPPDALAAAAALAAWFSKGRGAAKVEVHWTQARRVRKPRGAPAGAVLMDEFHSFVVQPRAPAEIAADTGLPADG